MQDMGWLEVSDDLRAAIRRAYDAQKATGLGAVLLADVWERVRREAMRRPDGFAAWFQGQTPTAVLNIALAFGTVRGLTLGQDAEGHVTVVEQ